MNLEAVRRIFYRTRSVEQTARELGVSLAVAHHWILCITGNRDVNAETFR